MIITVDHAWNETGPCILHIQLTVDVGENKYGECKCIKLQLLTGLTTNCVIKSRNYWSETISNINKF